MKDLETHFRLLEYYQLAPTPDTPTQIAPTHARPSQHLIPNLINLIRDPPPILLIDRPPPGKVPLKRMESSSNNDETMQRSTKVLLSQLGQFGQRTRDEFLRWITYSREGDGEGFAWIEGDSVGGSGREDWIERVERLRGGR